MKAVRLKQLEQLIAEKGFVTVEAICQTFDVHINTARADIKELVRKGVAEKRYGGVACVKNALPSSYVERDQTKRSIREEIGMKAARFLCAGDTIYVDSGTTALQLLLAAEKLPPRLTVITNSLSVAQWVMYNTDYTLFVLPGKGNREMNAFSSLETIESVKNYNIQKAFIGCRKIATNGALTSASSVDARLKEAVIAASQHVYLMADADKIGNPELYSFSRVEKMDCWICDVPTEQVLELAGSYGANVM